MNNKEKNIESTNDALIQRRQVNYKVIEFCSICDHFSKQKLRCTKFNSSNATDFALRGQCKGSRINNLEIFILDNVDVTIFDEQGLPQAIDRDTFQTVDIEKLLLNNENLFDPDEQDNDDDWD